MTESLTIQIVFNGPEGKRENGPSFVAEAPSNPTPQPNYGEWDKDTCAISLLDRLSGRGGDLEACMRVMKRLDCWKECIAQFTQGPHPDATVAKELLSFWVIYGHYSIPRGLKDNLPVFVDALRYHLPSYSGPGLTLYRGEVEERHLKGIYGIAWTSRLDAARIFAGNRITAKEGNGVILKIDASTEMIVADHTMLIGGRTEDELEYIVDPRMIRSVTVVP